MLLKDGLELAPGRIVLPVAVVPRFFGLFWPALRSKPGDKGERYRSFKNNSAPPLVHATFFKGLNLLRCTVCNGRD